MADEEQDVGHVIGMEHFPTCECFQDPARGAGVRGAMYHMAQDHAESFVQDMITNNICPEAMPYFIALFESMAGSMISSAIVARRENTRITRENMEQFASEQRKIYDKVRERSEALMRRADRLTVGFGQGSDSVQ